VQSRSLNDRSVPVSGYQRLGAGAAAAGGLWWQRRRNRPVGRCRNNIDDHADNNVDHANDVDHADNNVDHANDVDHADNNVDHANNDVDHTNNDVDHTDNDVDHTDHTDNNTDHTDNNTDHTGNTHADVLRSPLHLFMGLDATPDCAAIGQFRFDQRPNDRSLQQSLPRLCDGLRYVEERVERGLLEFQRLLKSRQRGAGAVG
jgi:hypothetical protein